MSFTDELKQRKLVQWALAYAAGAWIVLQVLGLMADSYEWPRVVMRIAIGVAVMGFFLAAVLAWHHGERGLQRATRSEALLLVVIIAVGASVIWRSEHAQSMHAISASNPASVSASIASTPDAASAAPAAIDKSLAVLPFKNLSNAAETDGFVDGVHDDLLIQLAKVRALRVTSRTSVMEYRNSDKRLPQIAAELHVAHILEGGVQRAGNRIRINVQLIDARSDQPLWAETYDKELTAENIFAIQGELASSIAQALATALTPTEKASTSRVLTTNLQALDLYRRAIVLDWEGGEQDGNKLRWLNEALALDPKFAAALAYRAKSRMSQFWNSKPDSALRDAARRDIDAGRAISPDLPELDIAEGYYYYWGFRDYARASQFVDRALAVIPNEARLHALRGFIARRAGDPALAISEMAAAFALDPATDGYAADLVYTNMLVGNYSRSEQILGEALSLHPDSAALAFRQTLLEAGVKGDLVAANKTLASRPLTFDFAASLLRWWLANARGDEAAALAAADFGKVQDTSQVFYPPALMRGISLRYAGKTDQAKAQLEQALTLIDARRSADPTDRRILQSRCLALGALARRDAAIAACREVLALDFHDALDGLYLDNDVAVGLALAGADEQALDALDKRSRAAMVFPAGLYELDPAYRSLRENPRFKAIMARLRARS